MKNLAISIIISSLILLFIIYKLDWISVWLIIKKVDLNLVLLAVLCQMSIIFISALRWKLFFTENNTSINTLYILRLTFIGAFFNNILPSATGGDAIRGYYIYKNGYGAAKAFSPIITERIIGLVTTLAMAAIFTPFIVVEDVLIDNIKLFLPIIFFISLACVFLIRVPVLYALIYRLLKSLESYRIISAALRIIESTHLYLVSAGCCLLLPSLLQ